MLYICNIQHTKGNYQLVIGWAPVSQNKTLHISGPVIYLGVSVFGAESGCVSIIIGLDHGKITESILTESLITDYCDPIG